MLSPRSARRQDGIVLLMAIIVLVALTLGALALTRSVYTTNVIAGNLAFQRAATNSAEIGVETAVSWLETNLAATSTDCGRKLHCDQVQEGYLADRSGDTKGHTNWMSYWNAELEQASTQVVSADGAGNEVRYAIERMCSQSGDPTDSANSCTISPNPTAGECAGGSSCAAGERNLLSAPPVYYRITVLVRGPRNTRSLVQAMVAL